MIHEAAPPSVLEMAAKLCHSCSGASEMETPWRGRIDSFGKKYSRTARLERCSTLMTGTLRSRTHGYMAWTLMTSRSQNAGTLTSAWSNLELAEEFVPDRTNKTRIGQNIRIQDQLRDDARFRKDCDVDPDIAEELGRRWRQVWPTRYNIAKAAQLLRVGLGRNLSSGGTRKRRATRWHIQLRHYALRHSNRSWQVAYETTAEHCAERSNKF